jgi:hypothetical protein
MCGWKRAMLRSNSNSAKIIVKENEDGIFKMPLLLIFIFFEEKTKKT